MQKEKEAVKKILTEIKELIKNDSALNQKTVARELNLSEPHFNMILNGKRRAEFSIMLKLFKIIGYRFLYSSEQRQEDDDKTEETDNFKSSSNDQNVNELLRMTEYVLRSEHHEIIHALRQNIITFHGSVLNS